MSNNDLYKASYGAWAGRPQGVPPNYANCCVEVYPEGRGATHRQCAKPRGFGPDEAYCKTHDPSRVAAAAQKRQAEWVARSNRERKQYAGATFYDALKLIAEGHNDARGLAQQVIKDFHKGDHK